MWSLLALLAPWDYCLMKSVPINNSISWKFHFPNTKEQLTYSCACNPGHKCHEAYFDDHWFKMNTIATASYLARNASLKIMVHRTVMFQTGLAVRTILNHF